MLPSLSLLRLFALIMFLSASALAQKPLSPQPNSSVRGVTVDFLGARVPNVTVKFDGPAGNHTVVSDLEGHFEIHLPAGQYRVTVAKFGIFYPYQRKKLRVSGARVRKFDVVLRYDTKKYPPVVSNTMIVFDRLFRLR